MSGWEGLLANFNQLMQKPEILGLAQGLLSQASPSMTTPRSFAGGLQAGLGGYQDAAEREFEKSIKLAELQEKRNAEERKRKQSEALMNFLGGGTLFNSGSEDNPNDDRKQRAATALALGDYDAAVKILTEKPEKDITKTPTQSFVTTNQEIIQNSQKAVSLIDKLIESDIPGALTKHAQPNAGPAYQSKIYALADAVLKARNLPNQGAIFQETVHDLMRKPFEGEADYKKRLEMIKEELSEARANAENVTSIGNKFPKSENKPTASGKTVRRVYKGKVYDIPEHLVAKFDEEHR